LVHQHFENEHADAGADAGRPGMANLPFDETHGAATAAQLPEDRAPSDQADAPKRQVDGVTAVPGPFDDLRGRAENQGDEAVPHPKQAPILQDRRIGAFLKQAINEASESALASRDGFADFKGLEIGCQSAGRGVTSIRRFLQALQANRFQVTRYAGIQEPRRRRVLFLHQ